MEIKDIPLPSTPYEPPQKKTFKSMTIKIDESCYSVPSKSFNLLQDYSCYELPQHPEHDMDLLSQSFKVKKEISSISGDNINKKRISISLKRKYSSDSENEKSKCSMENIPDDVLELQCTPQIVQRKIFQRIECLNSADLLKQENNPLKHMNSAPYDGSTPKRNCSVRFFEHTSQKNFSLSVDETPKQNYSKSSEPKLSLKHQKEFSPSMSIISKHTLSSTLPTRRSLPAEIECNSSSSSSSCFTPKYKGLTNSFEHLRHSLPSKHSSFNLAPKRRTCDADQTPYIEDNFYLYRKRIRPLLPHYNALELQSLESVSGFIDCHCHLDFLFQRECYEGSYSEYQQKKRNTYPACYKGCLAIFCNPFTFSKKSMWEKFLEEENVWASFGCHPHNAKNYDSSIEKELCAALDHPKVRAIGEIGLDYSNRNNCAKEMQAAAFRRQLKIGVEKKLPIVVHCREANEDGMAIMKEILSKDYMVHLHCFTDSWEWAEKWLYEFPNLCIGITNVVTFPSAENVHEVAKNIPLHRLLLETDAPYFIPKVVKGTRFSHPGMAIHVAAQIAAIKGISVHDVLDSTRKNTKRVYNI